MCKTFLHDGRTRDEMMKKNKKRRRRRKKRKNKRVQEKMSKHVNDGQTCTVKH